MQTILIALDVIMSFALWWRSGCRIFALIQCVQLLEFFAPIYENIGCFMSFDQFNILIEGFTVLSTRRLVFPRCVMLVHAYMKLYRYAGIDCTYQMTRGPLYWSIYWLNNALIVILFGYALKQPLLRLWRKHAPRSQAYAPETAG